METLKSKHMVFLLMTDRNGFTLIELLVVVAIIGILAAVGVVAYNGYTNAAKKAATKNNHSQVVKYVTAELQKCNLGESSTMSNNLNCNNMTATTIIEAVEKSLPSFKNPYQTNQGGVVAKKKITSRNFSSKFFTYSKISSILWRVNRKQATQIKIAIFTIFE